MPIPSLVLRSLAFIDAPNLSRAASTISSGLRSPPIARNQAGPAAASARSSLPGSGGGLPDQSSGLQNPRPDLLDLVCGARSDSPDFPWWTGSCPTHQRFRLRLGTPARERRDDDGRWLSVWITGKHDVPVALQELHASLERRLPPIGGEIIHFCRLGLKRTAFHQRLGQLHSGLEPAGETLRVAEKPIITDDIVIPHAIVCDRSRQIGHEHGEFGWGPSRTIASWMSRLRSNFQVSMGPYQCGTSTCQRISAASSDAFLHFLFDAARHPVALQVCADQVLELLLRMGCLGDATRSRQPMSRSYSSSSSTGLITVPSRNDPCG